MKANCVKRFTHVTRQCTFRLYRLRTMAARRFYYAVKRIREKKNYIKKNKQQIN